VYGSKLTREQDIRKRTPNRRPGSESYRKKVGAVEKKGEVGNQKL